MKQSIKLDRQDLASLREGQPLTLTLVNGQELEILFDGGPGSPSKDPQPCPYCPDGRTLVNLGAHIRQVHPGKGLTGVKCPDCGQRYLSGTGMSVHRRAMHTKKPQLAKKKETSA